MGCLANSLCRGDTQELANQINAFLLSASADFIPLSPDVKFTKTDEYNVPDRFVISVADVQEKLTTMITRKVTGPNDIPNRVLKDCTPLLAGPVCIIFNTSLRDGYVPVLWKSAIICPLAKVNPPTILHKQIRPISLTPVL